MKPAGQHRLAPAGDAIGHHYRFGAGAGTLVHRGVGSLHARQQRDLGLKLEQHLQRALADLGLVGRVRRKKLAALNQMIDRGRNVVAVGAGTEKERHRTGGDIARRHLV